MLQSAIPCMDAFLWSAIDLFFRMRHSCPFLQPIPAVFSVLILSLFCVDAIFQHRRISAKMVLAAKTINSCVSSGFFQSKPVETPLRYEMNIRINNAELAR
jgi:hypothetical protein